MTNVLVIGADGQLGQCLLVVSKNYPGLNFSFAGRHEADILNVDSLDRIFEIENPEFVINCAAYTAVDLAEDFETLAKQINVEGAKNIANACETYGCTLIHISTDFVFEGRKVMLLNERDETNPVSVYGSTKLGGEQAIQALLEKHIIIRTSWLYSSHANNFVKTMLKLGADRDVLNVVADQVGTPTYAIDLAGAILQIIQSEDKTYGVFHYSNEGLTSWFDFAASIFKLTGNNIKVNPIDSNSYPTKATRPGFSVLDKTKIKQAYQLEIPYWVDSLKSCLTELKALKN